MGDNRAKDGKFHYLYKTVHIPTSRYYVGKRSEKTMSSYLGSGYHLKNAIKKYGKQEFSKIILCYFESGEAAYEAELRYITEDMVKSKDCFNERLGGTGSGMGKDNIIHAAMAAGKVDRYRFRTAERAAKRQLHAQILADSPEGHPWRIFENRPDYNRLMAGTHNFQKVKPWDHTQANAQSKNVWANAYVLYSVWVKDKPTYSYLYRMTKDMFDFKFIRLSLYNPVIHFEKGWIPTQDPDWLTFKQNYKVKSDE